MAVRNFWIDARIDGRKTELAGGPAGKFDGMRVCIKQRNHGGIDVAVKIESYANCNGELVTNVFVAGELVGTYTTQR